MQLSKFTDYSFRSLLYLATHNERLCTVDELAKNLDISVNHLKKVIHKLAKTHYIISLKGRSGGLKLGLPPKEINLGKVFIFTEENLNIVECFNPDNNCPLIVHGCKLKTILGKSLDSFVVELSSYTLNDLL
ncbi:MAG: Rrf2 family transcriptional regulator [Clostridium sp.]